jgi:hypothetical protein
VFVALDALELSGGFACPSAMPANHMTAAAAFMTFDDTFRVALANFDVGVNNQAWCAVGEITKS